MNINLLIGHFETRVDFSRHIVAVTCSVCEPAITMQQHIRYDPISFATFRSSIDAITDRTFEQVADIQTGYSRPSVPFRSDPLPHSHIPFPSLSSSSIHSGLDIRHTHTHSYTERPSIHPSNRIMCALLHTYLTETCQ